MMDKKILKCYDEGDLEKLSAALSDLSSKEISTAIDARVLGGKGDPTSYVRAVLQGSCGGNSENVQRRLFVYKHCIQLLQDGNMASKIAAELVGVLLLEMDSLPGHSLVQLAEVFQETIRNGTPTNSKCLELFPKILSTLSAQEVVVCGDSSMSGTEFKSHILNSLCSGRWDAGNVIHLAAMFKDVAMTTSELQFVLEKLVRMLKSVELQELPPLIYQLLLLSTKGHKKLVLEGVTSFFIQQDELCRKSSNDSEMDELSEVATDADQLRHVEGTVILHFTFAIKQDQDLGREFIKYLKTSQQSSCRLVLAPFNVAIALSMTRIHRFEEQIYELLKGAILKSFRDNDRQAESHWVREVAAEQCDVTDLLLAAVQNSVYGWDHVTEGLVQLGFTLMDAFGPKAVFGKAPDSGPMAQLTPTQQACAVGSKVLLHTFKAHEVVRTEILEQILNRVITKGTNPVTHFIDLLSSVVTSAPQLLLDSQSKIREALDYVAMLVPATAEGLLNALLPLLKYSMTLKDSMMLVLRKAMFSRLADSRKIAVTGFLLMLKHFKVLGGVSSSQASQTFSCSQVMVDVHVQNNPGCNEALCLEILGSLRRSLSQQADVRLTLYEGMYEVVHRNTQLAQPVLAMLLIQLKKFYERADDVNPPVRLDSCILAQGDQVFLQEPLSHLLSCIQQCLLRVQELKFGQRDGDMDDDDDGDGSVQVELENMFDSLTRRMIKSELEDFELDKSADFSLANSVGVKNSIFAILALGLYEVLMEFNFDTVHYELVRFESVLQLSQNYQKLSEVLKEKPGGATGSNTGGGGKRGRSAGKPPVVKSSAGGGKASTKNKTRSMLSITAAANMLKSLFSDTIPHHQASLKVLRDSADFSRYVVQITLQKLQQIQDRGSCDGNHGHNMDKLFRHICTISRVLLVQYSSSLEETPGAQERGRPTPFMYLEGLATAIGVVCNRFKERLLEFLKSCDTESEGSEDQTEAEIVYKFIRKFQSMVITLVMADSEDHSMREVVSLLCIIGQLCKRLQAASTQLTQVQTWLQKLCAEQNLDDVAAVKVLINLLLTVTQQVQSSGSVVRDMAQDIHSQLGDIDQDVDIEDRTHFAVINQRTAAPTVLLAVVSHIDHEIDHTDWVLGRMKADLTSKPQATTGDDLPGPTQRETAEKSVCNRLGLIINAFHELVQSAVPLGPCVENLFKAVTKLYQSLALLTKYYLTMYNMQCGHLTNRFERLVKLSGTDLTHHVYSLITYIQSMQNEQLNQATTLKKKGKKKEAKEASTVLGKSQILKELKSVPNLIFSIEQYERYLIQLSKKSKVNLMEHMKLSTSRDFRINVTVVQDALERQKTSSDEEGEDEKENEDGNNEATQGELVSSDGDETEDEASQPPAKKQVRTDNKAVGKAKLGVANRSKNTKA